ncbi:unnamed protein product [Menidia menidia]|uniref:(Atlantic silverside) hypothetical protein n=1 Tax=Menidia menidia TaxID=238744 RepID=A0A8S4BHG7_9TELE|nr:unnamed protein product [Menidia menidia]
MLTKVLAACPGSGPRPAVLTAPCLCRTTCAGRGLLSFGARSAVHDEGKEMSFQPTALSLQFLPLDIY